MTDYRDWVLRDEESELILTPRQGSDGTWCYAQRFADGTYSAWGQASDAVMASQFKPPVVWAYYKAEHGGLDGRGRATLYPVGSDKLATHRSSDGGDTIERI